MRYLMFLLWAISGAIGSYFTNHNPGDAFLVAFNIFMGAMLCNFMYGRKDAK